MGSVAEQSERSRTRRALGDRSFRWLLVVLLVAAPLLLHAGRGLWFHLDEWDFLLRRDLARPGTLLDGWFGHNVALPAAAYRVLVAVFGVSSYRPYLVLAIAGHYAVVLAVWALARRLGVRGWIAVATVLPLIGLGAGWVNILWGFQVTNTAALALSLLHLLLADRDGPWSRADTAGVLCGAAALACSGIAVAGTVGVGVAVLLRRGPALAALHTVPLGVAWSAWHLLAPSRGLEASTRFDRGTVDFLTSLPKAALGGLGGSEPVAFALGALAVLGVVSGLWWARANEPARPWRRGAAALVGCAAMLVAFAVLVAVQRLPGAGQRGPTESRYLYVVVALTLPLVALGVEAVARHRPRLVVVPLALVAVGAVHGVRTLAELEPLSDREGVLAIANSERLATTPSRELLVVFGVATTDELRELADLPGLPGDEGVGRDLQLRADLVLGLHPGPPDHEARCRSLGAGPQQLEPGDTIDFVGDVTLTAVDGADRSLPVAFSGRQGSRLTASGPLTVELVASPESRVYICAGQ